MTNGSSQGLFVVVAIVIFGIFVFLSYLLFRDIISPNLSGIFKDCLEQAENNLINMVTDNPTINSEISIEISDLNFNFNKLDFDSPTFPRLSENINVTIKNLTDKELSYKVKFTAEGRGLFIGNIHTTDINSIYSTELEKTINLKPNEIYQFDFIGILNAQEYESSRPETYSINSSGTKI